MMRHSEGEGEREDRKQTECGNKTETNKRLQAEIKEEDKEEHEAWGVTAFLSLSTDHVRG